VNKKESIALLNNEGWTKADAKRALESLDFKVEPDINELAILQAASQFAGAELLHRQYLQRAQKTQVTKKNKEIQKYIAQIKELVVNGGGKNQEQIAELENKISNLVKDNGELTENNQELKQANDTLQKDNKAMASIVSEIKFKLAVQIKDILSLKDIRQIKTKLVKLINYISG